MLSYLVGSKIKIFKYTALCIQQLKNQMSQQLKDWSWYALVKYNQWKLKAVKDYLKAPCFEQLKYPTTIFDQVKKLQNLEKDWTDQAKSIRKKLYYDIMAQSVLSLPCLPEDYKKKCKQVRSNIDTASALLKNIKRPQHLQQAIKICEKPNYKLYQSEEKRVKKLTRDNKQLLMSYCQQFFVYVEFLRLHILQILQIEKVKRQSSVLILNSENVISQESQNNQRQLVNYQPNSDTGGARCLKDQFQSSTAAKPPSVQLENISSEMKDQQKRLSQQFFEKDWLEIEYENWLQKKALFQIGEKCFHQI